MKNKELEKLLLRSLTDILLRGIELLYAIDDRLYIRAEADSFSGGGPVGGHFRHCLEFIGCFLSGIEEGRVDYDRRERNICLDTEREYAILEFQRMVYALENFRSPEMRTHLLVRPEEISDGEIWCASSLERELEFLRSHTVHHYAVIAFKLRALGFEVPRDFGVAPSTLRFWEREMAAR